MLYNKFIFIFYTELEECEKGKLKIQDRVKCDGYFPEFSFRTAPFYRYTIMVILAQPSCAVCLTLMAARVLLFISLLGEKGVRLLHTFERKFVAEISAGKL